MLKKNYKAMVANSRSESVFLEKLQRHAELQAELNTSRLIPKHLDWLTARIGTYPWQTLVFLASLSTAVVVLWRQWP